MSTPTGGSIKLTKGVKGKRKTFFLELRRNSGSTPPHAGRVFVWEVHDEGKRSSLKEIEDGYQFDSVVELLKKKIASGYGFESVNDKPFPSGNLNDAVLLMEQTLSWDATATAQPARRIRPREVSVTFDVGQCAPIW